MSITGTEHPSSGRIRYLSGVKTLEKVYQYDAGDDYVSEMPSEGAYDSGLGLYFISYQSQPGPGYTMVMLEYSSDPNWGGSFNPGDGDTEYWASASPIEAPIELHSDWLRKWSFDLFTDNGGAVPGFAATDDAAANSATGPSSAGGNGYLWSQSHPGDSWKLIQARTKPGVESFLQPRGVVVARSFHRLKANAEAAMQQAGFLVTPAETFGYTGGSWLITDASLEFDGKYWVATIEFTHSAEGWDTDIYSTGSTTTTTTTA